MALMLTVGDIGQPPVLRYWYRPASNDRLCAGTARQWRVAGPALVKPEVIDDAGYQREQCAVLDHAGKNRRDLYIAIQRFDRVISAGRAAMNMTATRSSGKISK